MKSALISAMENLKHTRYATEEKPMQVENDLVGSRGVLDRIFSKTVYLKTRHAEA